LSVIKRYQRAGNDLPAGLVSEICTLYGINQHELDSLDIFGQICQYVATPVNWKPGEDVIIAGSVSDDEAKKIYPQGWNAPRPYLRIVPQPK
jgi:hypothetical protein